MKIYDIIRLAILLMILINASEYKSEKGAGNLLINY